MAKINEVNQESNKTEQMRMAEEYPIEKVGANRYLSIQFIAALIDNDLLVNYATFYAYLKYMKLCTWNSVKPISQISFSLLIVNNFNIEVADKKAYGKKFRVFRRYKVVQDSSGQIYKL